MKHLTQFCLLLVCLLLTACDWRDLPLLQIELAQLGPARVAQQRMLLTRGEETHVLENMLESGPDGLQVIGLAMGLRVYSFNYDGHKLQVGPGHLPTGLSEQRIANDMLLIHMPAGTLAHALPNGWQIREEIDGIALKNRKLQQDEETVVEVQYHAGAPWEGRSILVDHRHGYQLILDSTNEP